MQTCSNCGAAVRESARFCTACGTQLNDASSGSSPFSWGAAIEQSPVSHDAGTTAGWPTRGADDDSSDPDVADATTSEETTLVDHLSAQEVDEETGIVLGDPDDAPLQGIVDATELEDVVEGLEDDGAVVDGPDEPDLSVMEDAVTMSTTDSGAEDQASQETLAAWTHDWSTGDAVSETAGVSSETESSSPNDDDDDDNEDVLEKAERLIAQLQALVPKLARPKPANPTEKLKPRLLADELDEGTDGSQWADLRDVLEKARDNPNDITHLMNVSGNASRLLDLLDDRDYLAQRATSVAQRLRNPDLSDDI